MNPNEPVHFAGVPNGVKISIIFAALLLGSIIIGLAWRDASNANQTLAFGQEDVATINAIVGSAGNDHALIVHTLNSMIHLKAITNHQSLAGLAIGSGSAFLAIGFALFLLGADGAFRIQYAGKADTKLAFYATAPGLLCFLLAAILIVIGTTRKHEILLGDFDLTAQKTTPKGLAESKTDGSAFSEGKAMANAQPQRNNVQNTSRPRANAVDPGQKSFTADTPFLQQKSPDKTEHSIVAQTEATRIPASKPGEIGDSLRLSQASINSPRYLLLSEHVCIDRLLTSQIGRPMFNARVTGGRSRAIAPIGKTWMNGSTLRVSFLDGEPKLQAKVKEYAEQWTQHANIHFAFGSHPSAEIRVSFKGSELWSYVGTDSRQVPAESPTMNLGGITKERDDSKIRAIVLHQFGHVLGLEHEFNPPKNKVEWNRQLLHQFFSQAPNYWTPEETDRIFIQKYSLAKFNGALLDPQSIMMMAVPKEFTLDGFQIPWNRELSNGDKALIGSAKLYPSTSK